MYFSVWLQKNVFKSFCGFSGIFSDDLIKVMQIDFLRLYVNSLLLQQIFSEICPFLATCGKPASSWNQFSFRLFIHSSIVCFYLKCRIASFAWYGHRLPGSDMPDYRNNGFENTFLAPFDWKPSQSCLILKGSLVAIPSPSPSVKIQIMSWKSGLRFKGKTLLGPAMFCLYTSSKLSH